MKYLFNNAVFTPDEAIKLTVDGKTIALPKRLVALLKYFLETNEQISDNNKILAAVWGPGEHTFDAVRTAVYRLNGLLPDDTQVKNVMREGYVLSVDLKKVETKYQKTELILEKSRYIKNATTISLVSFFLLAIVGLGTWADKWIDPPPVYTLQNVNDVFTRDHLVGLPQLSPDGKYVAHRLSNKIFEDDYLALTHLTSGEAKRLSKMRFDDGFKWDWAGNKIVYQHRTKTSCQIRLLQFDDNKDVTSKRLLTQCLV